jgi:hypothetical protein
MLFDVLNELKFRVTSPVRRDELAKKITSLLKEFGDVNIPPNAERQQISKAKSDYFAEADQRAAVEKRRKLSEARAKRDAEAKARRAEEVRTKTAERAGLEAEQKAKVAAAAKARLEAEAKAQCEEEARKEVEQAEVAAAEKNRLEAEAKAKREEAVRKETKRKAKEAAAAKARLEAEVKAQREEEARKEAEAKAKREEAVRKETKRKAKEASAAKARLEAKAKAQREEEARKEAERQAEEAAAEKTRLEAEAKECAEQAKREKVRLAAEENARKQVETETKRVTREQARQAAEVEKVRLAEAQARESEETDKALQEVEAKVFEQIEVGLFAAEEIKAASSNDNRAVADARRDETSEIFSEKLPAKTIHRRLSREEQREERRERARLRRLERDEKTEDQADEDAGGQNEEYVVEEAEQFAPYLRSVPAHWSDWSEQDWNIKLLHYCFVQKAFDNSSQGIPSTEEDLAFVTCDRDSAPADIAQALVNRVREFSFNHGLSPARLLIKRLETWDYKSPSPPRYFAFLWTTCLIAQGFPSPFEQGEFHRRYERDDVYGDNETQFLSRNLPAAWVQLSKWLERDDIFDAHAHRRLVLPNIDPRRSIISHSWKLSFPCRSDRKRLHEVVGRDKEGHTSHESIDLQLISRICYQGGFTPEFTAAVKQQIDLVQRGNQVEEWLSALIQREIEARGTSQVQSGRKGNPKDLKGISPKIMLHLDDEDCYLELVLPSQSVAVEKPRSLSHKTYCAINLETKEKMPQVVRELDIDGKQEDLIVPELRIKIEEEGEEYVLRLRHEGLDNAVLAEWSCDGLATSNPYILFNSETNEIINDGALIGSSSSLLFRRSWEVVFSEGIECETEEPLSVSRLGGWRLLLLTKTSSLEKSETISLVNVTGEKCDICWVDPGDGKSNSRPLLKGLGLPGQANGFVMLAENPELWLPPAVTNAQIEMFKIEDDEFYMPIGSIEVTSTESWEQAGVRKLITGPGLYSARLSYFDNFSARTRKWSRNILIAKEPDIKSLHPISLQAKYRFRETLQALDLERNVSPLVFKQSQEFWNAEWIIFGLWPDEKIRVRLDGDGENYSQVLTADNSGSCKIPISAFESYLLSRKSAKFSIQRQGFICQYDLAVLIGSSGISDQEIKEEQGQSTIELRRRPVQRRRLVYRVDLVVHGDRGSFDIQKMVVDELDELIEEKFGHLDRRSTEYPEGKFARGMRFVFHRLSFPDIENESRERLRDELDSLVSSIGNKSGLAFSAEWSRAKE